jgi:hypothetical protein
MGQGGLDWCASGEGQWSAIVNTVMNSGYHSVWGVSLLVEERELFKQVCVACCSYVMLFYATLFKDVLNCKGCVRVRAQAP